ncbi:threonine dehydrogenase-like Zn-dependent dehydrogenase [Actinocorallia herbida]|uniref:Threonine dehydrogenase-like Zn-dependent dehydrogenase n=1 Tax=Actinocorallia herbida TaxID=58109 RepID=A0A3N1D1W6_9ACTN|nr:zinc-binding dehydrogenase [Actinocorallia herbida]ROO87543.1 threonine dehydrogenase-like Zn-dependent dehydrogenase [Actinocorallia herbida]
MKSVIVTGPGKLEIAEVPIPQVGPRDVLVKMKACGICGADPHALAEGGIPAGASATPMGHEPAGEIVEVGAETSGLRPGDRVVIDPTLVTDSITGGGGPQGALSEYLLVREAAPGVNVAVFPEHVPWHVAALAEPLAVARRSVDRTHPRPEHKAVVFGAGPVGLGALLALKHHGVSHVVVADVQPNRLDKALALGADAVINSAEQDVRARLVELHGEGTDAFGRTGLPGTDLYLDAAGVPDVLRTVFAGPKLGAVLGIVAIHRDPFPVDFQMLIPSELTIVHSMGHPTEMFSVIDDIAANTDACSAIVSDLIPFSEVERAFDLAGRPGATDKVVVTFE